MFKLVKKAVGWYFRKYSELYEKGYLNPYA
jgi:hypothetical protein